MDSQLDLGSEAGLPHWKPELLQDKTKTKKAPDLFSFENFQSALIFQRSRG